MENISRWRIVLVATTLVVLAGLGAGLVMANDPSPGTPGTAPAGDTGTAPTGGTGAGPALGSRPIRPNAGQGLPGRGLRGQRLVHLEGTLDLPVKGIVKVAFDHGTISALGEGTISVLEKDGATVTLKTDADTHVRKGGAPAKLSDLKKGDEVVVTSQFEDGSWVAYRIIVPPARPAVGSTP
jgi:hypothetical protein